MSMEKYSVPDVRALQVKELEDLKKREEELKASLDKTGSADDELARNQSRQKEVEEAIAAGDVAKPPF